MPRPASLEDWSIFPVATSPRPRRPWLRRSLLAAAAALVLLAFGAAPPPAPAQVRPGGARIAAPELDGVGWLGTDRPIRLKDLSGKVVILDFWTLC